MSIASTKVFKTSVLLFTVCLGLHLKTYVVNADATTNTQQGVVLKSTNLVTDKTVKVPVRVQPTVSTSNGSSSRGFTGGSTVASGSTSSVVNKAFEFLGRPYVWGANGPKAFDCSGFTKYVYSSFGINIPRTSQEQAKFGLAVSRSNLRQGDLVFFNTDGYASHVGLYIGNDQFIHASSGSKKVTVSELSGSYYNTRYIGARRIMQ